MKKKLTFIQKNDLIVSHKNAFFFNKDLALFQKKFSSHRLNNELARASTFNYERLDGAMLNELLEVCSIEEILENRGLIEKKPRTLDELKAIILGFNIPNFVNPDTFEVLGEELLFDLNKIEDNNEIHRIVDNIVNPKIESIDEVKSIFAANGFNIESINDNFFADFIGLVKTDIENSLDDKYSFLPKLEDEQKDPPLQAYAEPSEKEAGGSELTNEGFEPDNQENAANAASTKATKDVVQSSNISKGPEPAKKGFEPNAETKSEQAAKASDSKVRSTTKTDKKKEVKARNSRK